MSEQELKKWENKYKLYMLLHSGEILEGENVCLHCRESRGIINLVEHLQICPKQVLMRNDEGKMRFLPSEWWGSSQLAGYHFCTEWIKYV
jgi:hypothetical protein